MSERVGFAGLGVMGAPMAANLLAAGHDVIVFNRSPAPAEELAAKGARRAASLAELAEGADVIVTMLSDDAAVRAVVGGDEGLIALARPGSLIVDMSTVSPGLARELGAAAAERGVGMLDAPVSGGDVGAREGTLSIMVGGGAADLERARPLFEVLGSNVVHVGGPGAGQVVKACNQVLVAVTIAGVSEALVLGSKLGVEPSTILDVLSKGLAGNRVMEVRRSNFLEHSFHPGFKVDLHHKDLAIALGSAADADVSLAMAAITQQMFQALRARGRGGDDHSALLRVVEEQSAHRIGGSKYPRAEELVVADAWEDHVEELGPGRLRVCTKDDLHGVAPEMLDWWFAHMDRELYLAFHPVDHKEFAWVRGKEPERFVGATHLTHQQYGGEGPLMRAEITFVPPDEAFDTETFAAHDVGAVVCAEVNFIDEDGKVDPDVPVRFVHVAMRRNGGTELRSAWWIDVDENTDVERTTTGRLRHVHEEFGYLAGFLPQLYAERHG